MSRHRNFIRALLAIGIATSFAWASASVAIAGVTQIPGVDIAIDAGFVYDMNAHGDYVVAWSPNEGSRSTKVLRGSAIAGPGRIWSVRSGFASTPDVAIADNGTMALSWTDEPKGQHRGYRVKYGAVWSESDTAIVPHVLNRTRSDWIDNIGQVDLAINRSGKAAFTWVSGLQTKRIGFAIGQPDGSFAKSQAIQKVRRPGFLGNPEVSLDDAGGATVRWQYLGVNCRDDWFVPKHCRNQPGSLFASTASPGLQFSTPQKFGKGCDWSASDTAPDGQTFALVACPRGFRFTTGVSGQPFSTLQTFDVLAGNREISAPAVKILTDGRVVVAYASLRYVRDVPAYSQVGGSTGVFGSALGPPVAFTPEVNRSDAEQQGWFVGGVPTVLEGPGSQAYVAIFGDPSDTIASMDASGRLGQPVALPTSATSRLSVTPDGLGFMIFSRDRLSRKGSGASLWTSNFALPSN